MKEKKVSVSEVQDKSKSSLHVANRHDTPDWRLQLATTDRGNPKATFGNAVIAFAAAPEWTNVAFDQFKLEMVKRDRTSAKPWADADTLRALKWLHEQEIYVRKNEAHDAITLVAREHGFHPVKDYLESLTWDGLERVPNLFFDYFGVKPAGGERDTYVRAATVRWMISAVARIFQPGCKADHVLILHGPQGMGKSTGVTALVGAPWFSDNLSDIRNKDALLELSGNWVLELGELKQLVTVSEAEFSKAFFSRQTDKFRAPYGRVVEEHRRQCVFCGTTNSDSFLRDATGNRRYWVIRCGEQYDGREWAPGDLVDTKAIEKWRDQLWAESLARYKRGELWYLDSTQLIAAASAQRREFFEVDVWSDLVLRYVEPQDSVSVAEILNYALGKPQGSWNRADEMRVAGILKFNKWTLRRGRERRWFPPEK
jgi:putative DNA primase/helicase